MVNVSQVMVCKLHTLKIGAYENGKKAAGVIKRAKTVAVK